MIIKTKEIMHKDYQNKGKNKQGQGLSKQRKEWTRIIKTKERTKQGLWKQWIEETRIIKTKERMNKDY